MFWDSFGLLWDALRCFKTFLENFRMFLKDLDVFERFGTVQGYFGTFFINTRGYSPPSAESFICPLGKKRPNFAVLANFRPFLVSGSNLSDFQ